MLLFTDVIIMLCRLTHTQKHVREPGELMLTDFNEAISTHLLVIVGLVSRHKRDSPIMSPK